MGFPTARYRLIEGEVEMQLFDSDDFPTEETGWYHDPYAAMEGKQEDRWAEDIDREVLEKMYEAEFGKKPHHRMKDESIIKALENGHQEKQG